MSSDHNRPGRATAPYFIKEFGELGLGLFALSLGGGASNVAPELFMGEPDDAIQIFYCRIFLLFLINSAGFRPRRLIESLAILENLMVLVR
jgi:hypothetical protein